MAKELSIKTQLANVASNIFWELFLKITKKDNVYKLHFNRNWDPMLVQKIRNGEFNSWGDSENKHIELHDLWNENWNNFRKQAYIINPEFWKWFNDSDRWFVPNNYLDYRFEN